MHKFLSWRKFGVVENADDNELHVTYHKKCSLRCFVIFLVDTSIFMDKRITYVDVAYLKYFIDLSANHEWN